MRCLRCFRSIKACFCESIEPFFTQTEFKILMHPMEAKRQRVGTGRIANLILKNSQIIIGTDFTTDPEVNEIINSPKYHTMLLYPGKNSLNITETPIQIDKNKKLMIFIIDGTWPCAKTMMRDSLNLQKLPRISFKTDNISLFKIKQQPATYCLSTIESIYYLLNGLEKWGNENLQGKQEILPSSLQKIVDFQIKCINDPTLNSYRKGHFIEPSTRKPSVKWEYRKICFEDKNFSKES